MGTRVELMFTKGDKWHILNIHSHHLTHIPQPKAKLMWLLQLQAWRNTAAPTIVYGQNHGARNKTGHLFKNSGFEVKSIP